MERARETQDPGFGPCYFCGKDDGTAKINGNHWFPNPDEQPHGGHYARVNACSDCFHADAFKKHPRKPRQPRQQRYAYGDYAWLVAFNKRPKAS